jgi:hypothetical protein
VGGKPKASFEKTMKKVLSKKKIFFCFLLFQSLDGFNLGRKKIRKTIPVKKN